MRTRFSRWSTGPLRAGLRTRLRPTAADVLVERIVAALGRHAPSGIRKRATTAPPPRHTERAISVGLIAGSDAGMQQTLVVGIEAVGLAAVAVGRATTLGSRPAAEWVDAFLVTSDLPAADVRELAWYVSEREQRAVVVVWPIGEGGNPWGRAIPGAVVLRAPDFALLAETLVEHVGGLRETTPDGEAANAIGFGEPTKRSAGNS